VPDWTTVVDYTSTPLSVKLGIGSDSRVKVLHAPRDIVLGLDPRVKVAQRTRGEFDVVVAFFTRAEKLEDEMETLSRTIKQTGGLWIAWPKNSSGVATTMSDHVVRERALPFGLVDNKVCAIDTTWTALRLVWRRENRHSHTKSVQPTQ
jgi:hypothetical protein